MASSFYVDDVRKLSSMALNLNDTWVAGNKSQDRFTREAFMEMFVKGLHNEQTVKAYTNQYEDTLNSFRITWKPESDQFRNMITGVPESRREEIINSVEIAQVDEIMGDVKSPGSIIVSMNSTFRKHVEVLSRISAELVEMRIMKESTQDWVHNIVDAIDLILEIDQGFIRFQAQDKVDNVADFSIGLGTLDDLTDKLQKIQGKLEPINDVMIKSFAVILPFKMIEAMGREIDAKTVVDRNETEVSMVITTEVTELIKYQYRILYQASVDLKVKVTTNPGINLHRERLVFDEEREIDDQDWTMEEEEEEEEEEEVFGLFDDPPVRRPLFQPEEIRFEDPRAPHPARDLEAEQRLKEERKSILEKEVDRVREALGSAIETAQTNVDNIPSGAAIASVDQVLEETQDTKKAVKFNIRTKIEQVFYTGADKDRLVSFIHGLMSKTDVLKRQGYQALLDSVGTEGFDLGSQSNLVYNLIVESSLDQLSGATPIQPRKDSTALFLLAAQSARLKNEEMVIQLARAQDNVKSSKDEVNALQTIIESQKADTTFNKEQVERITELLESKTSDYEKALRDLELLKSKVIELTDELNNLQTVMAKTDTSSDEINQVKASFESRLATVMIEQDSLKDEILNHETTVKEKDLEMLELMGKLKNTEDSLSLEIAKSTTFGKVVKRLEIELLDAESFTVRQTEANTVLEAAVEESRKEVLEANAQLDAMKNVVSDEASVVQAELAAQIKLQSVELERKNAELVLAMDALGDSNVDLEARNIQLSDRIKYYVEKGLLTKDQSDHINTIAIHTRNMVLAYQKVYDLVLLNISDGNLKALRDSEGVEIDSNFQLGLLYGTDEGILQDPEQLISWITLKIDEAINEQEASNAIMIASTTALLSVNGSVERAVLDSPIIVSPGASPDLFYAFDSPNQSPIVMVDHDTVVRAVLSVDPSEDSLSPSPVKRREPSAAGGSESQKSLKLLSREFHQWLLQRVFSTEPLVGTDLQGRLNFMVYQDTTINAIKDTITNNLNESSASFSSEISALNITDVSSDISTTTRRVTRASHRFMATRERSQEQAGLYDHLEKSALFSVESKAKSNVPVMRFNGWFELTGRRTLKVNTMSKYGTTGKMVQTQARNFIENFLFGGLFTGSGLVSETDAQSEWNSSLAAADLHYSSLPGVIGSSYTLKYKARKNNIGVNLTARQDDVVWLVTFLKTILQLSVYSKTRSEDVTAYWNILLSQAQAAGIYEEEAGMLFETDTNEMILTELRSNKYRKSFIQLMNNIIDTIYDSPSAVVRGRPVKFKRHDADTDTWKNVQDAGKKALKDWVVDKLLGGLVLSSSNGINGSDVDNIPTELATVELVSTPVVSVPVVSEPIASVIEPAQEVYNASAFKVPSDNLDTVELINAMSVLHSSMSAYHKAHPDFKKEIRRTQTGFASAIQDIIFDKHEGDEIAAAFINFKVPV